MKRWLPLLILCLCALLGCAPAIAPLPPLTMPVPNSPQEYRVVPMQWQANTVVTHDVQVFQEFHVGDQVKTSEERHVVQLSVVGRTAQGHVRVRLAYDGTALGDMLLDEQGRLVDAFPTNPADMAEFQMYVQTAGSAGMREIASKTLRRGEPVRVTVPSAPFIKILPPEYHGGFEKSVSIELTFTGYVRLGAAHAIAITTKAANLLKSPLYLPSTDKKAEAVLNEVTVEEHSYYDPVGGYLLATYSVGIVNGRVAGRAVNIRSIQYQTLDRARSSGL